MNQSVRWLLWTLLPLALAAIAHAPALHGDFVNWDDPMYVLDNPLVEAPLAKGWAGLIKTESIGYPIPVTVFGYAAQTALFDRDASGFHGVSLLLHLAVVALAMALAKRLSAPLWSALFCASLFAIHPLTAEPVAWVVGQKDLLMAVFVLTALWVRAGPAGDRALPTALTALFTILAIASKPTAMVMPLVLWMLDRALGRPAKDARAFALLLVCTVFALLSAALSLAGHGFLAGEAPKPFGLSSLTEAAWAFQLELRHLVLPYPLLVRYYPPTGVALTLGAAIGVALAGLLAVGIAVAWRKNQRTVAFGLCAAVLFYVPVAGLAPLTRGPGDSYLYLPMALVVSSIALLLARIQLRRRQQALVLAGGLIGLGFLLLTWSESEDWHDSIALWQDLAAEEPNDPRALGRLGDAYLFTGRPDLALSIYESVTKSHPNFLTTRLNHGQVLEGLGQLAAAERLFADTAEKTADPNYRERYAFFLVDHTELEPSRPEVARVALIELAPILVERGKRATTVRRAAKRLAAVGQPALAQALEARANLLDRRQLGSPD